MVKYFLVYMIENLLSMTYKIDADDRIHELPYGYEPKAVEATGIRKEAVYEKKDTPDKKRSGSNAICLHGIRCGTDSGRSRGK